jgi:hypothetical protein
MIKQASKQAMNHSIINTTKPRSQESERLNLPFTNGIVEKTWN